MKKILTAVSLVLAVTAASAQDYEDRFTDRMGGEIFRTCAVIFTVGLFMFFIITIMKRIFEYRLKNKIVDKGISENIASSILKNRQTTDDRYINVKWFAVLAGLGAGLIIVNYTMPLGFHSLAIMSFSMAFSFLGYYLFIRNAEK